MTGRGGYRGSQQPDSETGVYALLYWHNLLGHDTRLSKEMTLCQGRLDGSKAACVETTVRRNRWAADQDLPLCEFYPIIHWGVGYTPQMHNRIGALRDQLSHRFVLSIYMGLRRDL